MQDITKEKQPKMNIAKIIAWTIVTLIWGAISIWLFGSKEFVFPFVIGFCVIMYIIKKTATKKEKEDKEDIKDKEAKKPKKEEAEEETKEKAKEEDKSEESEEKK